MGCKCGFRAYVVDIYIPIHRNNEFERHNFVEIRSYTVYNVTTCLLNTIFMLRKDSNTKFSGVSKQSKRIYIQMKQGLAQEPNRSTNLYLCSYVIQADVQYVSDKQENTLTVH